MAVSADLSEEQVVRREKTLLTALLLSAPGPLITGYAAFSSHSTTQLADFIRRTMELAAMALAWWVFRQVHRSSLPAAGDQARLEGAAGLGAAGAMLCSGMVMLAIAVSRLSTFSPGGKVTLGLVIAFLGLLTNAWFWRRYAALASEQYSSVIAAQQILYRAKASVDLCVVAALAAVAIAPDHPATRFVDLSGSAIVAAYLLWNGLRMAQSHLVVLRKPNQGTG